MISLLGIAWISTPLYPITQIMSALQPHTPLVCCMETNLFFFCFSLLYYCCYYFLKNDFYVLCWTLLTRIECYMWSNLISLLKIHNWLQNFETKPWLLFYVELCWLGRIFWNILRRWGWCSLAPWEKLKTLCTVIFLWQIKFLVLHAQLRRFMTKVLRTLLYLHLLEWMVTAATAYLANNLSF